MTDNRPDDDILDERIRALATAQYHAPEGSVPRDAMWAQIAAARRAARAATATEAPEPRGQERRRRTHQRTRRPCCRSRRVAGRARS